MKKELISQATAARLKGCSRQRINELISNGRLKTYTINGNSTRLVNKYEVETLEEKKKGRPQKYPRFKKGARVVVNSKKYPNVEATVVRPYGERLYVRRMDTDATIIVKVKDTKLKNNN